MTVAGRQNNLVVFDLDGTLLDSLRFTFQALHHAISPRIGRDLDLQDLVPLLEDTDTEIVRILVGDGNFAEALDDYLEFYRRHPGGAVLFDGVPSLLDALSAGDVPMAVVTGRGRASLDILLRNCGLSDWISVVLAADDGPAPKPAPDGIRHVAGLLGVEASGGVMIGDGPADLRAGRAAGLTTVAARWCGLIPWEQVEAERPEHVVETVEELGVLLGV